MLVDPTNSAASAWSPISHWWHPDNLPEVSDPHQMHRGSVEPVRFLCPEGHDFTLPLSAFLARGNPCQECTGDIVIAGINSFDVTHPDIAAMWHPSNAREVTSVSGMTTDTFRFRCADGHEFAASPRSLTCRGTRGCPRCANVLPTPGIDDLATLYPHLVREWADSTDPTAYTTADRRKVNWRCARGHEWTASVGDRTRGTGCPYCKGKLPVQGCNDLATTHPTWAAQWHPGNAPLRPTDVTATSARKIRWRADCGHTWTQPPRTRTSDDCLVCRGLFATAGVNDVATTHPWVSDYYDGSLNPTKHIDRYTSGSPVNITWRCPRGHSFTRSIRAMVNDADSPCLYCDGRLAIPGETDVPTLRPDLAEQLDTTVHPADYLVGLSLGSGRRAAWRCHKGHTWTARVVDRIHHASGCPDCAHEGWRSQGEDEVADYLKELGHTVRRNMRIDGSGHRLTYDIHLPEEMILIEYNGLYFHSDAFDNRGADYHARKRQLAADRGYRLITVWEDDWRDRQQVVKNMLANKTGRDTSTPIYARRTVVVGLDAKSARRFLAEHHIQGPGNGSVRLGLRNESGEIVALIVARIEQHDAIITRFATSSRVPGGFGKLLSALEAHLRQHKPSVARVLTFSDNTISDGDLYRNLGFHADKQIPPDYSYLHHGMRHHKFAYRIARFRTDPNLTFREGATERELAQENGLHRIWDAGKQRWVKRLR